MDEKWHVIVTRFFFRAYIFRMKRVKKMLLIARGLVIDMGNRIDDVRRQRSRPHLYEK